MFAILNIGTFWQTCEVVQNILKHRGKSGTFSEIKQKINFLFDSLITISSFSLFFLYVLNTTVCLEIVLKSICIQLVQQRLPSYDNAAIISGGGQSEYFDDHVITYACNRNFASAADSLTCRCDATTDPSNPSWRCTSATCLRSKHQIYQFRVER